MSTCLSSSNICLILFFYLMAMFFQFKVESRAIANKLRYAKDHQFQALEAAHPPQFFSPYKMNSYRLNNDDSIEESGKQLDSEDLRLLEKFYKEQTREGDPFFGHTSAKFLESEEGGRGASESIDLENQQQKKDRHLSLYTPTEKSHQLDDWTIDENLADLFDKLMLPLREPIENMIDDQQQQAKYAPTLKLLTSYNPAGDSRRLFEQETQVPSSSGNRIVGATLQGDEELEASNITSTSPLRAIELHDELFKEPPLDGKVRVRMYFHRAIHDDPKLYGFGPWKYWGHGWGLEYGYDPKDTGKQGQYQKGYTIERAFGRDFCKDPAKCRKPDPKFFKPLHSLGEQTASSSKQHTLIEQDSTVRTKRYAPTNIQDMEESKRNIYHGFGS